MTGKTMTHFKVSLLLSLCHIIVARLFALRILSLKHLDFFVPVFFIYLLIKTLLCCLMFLIISYGGFIFLH